jgi:quercetin 2,3-dioxygenase
MEIEMIEHRPFDTLGRIERDWLQARLHFRFGEIGQPEHAPLGPLYIWNDDTFAPQSGFGMHAHENVEIVTFVRSGAITHEDSFGNTGRIEAGNVQVMSAGNGIRHAERNMENEPTQLFQIWLTPRTLDGEPRWAHRRFDMDRRVEGFGVFASGASADIDAGALPIDADARLLAANMHAGQCLDYTLSEGAMAHLVPTAAGVQVNDVRLAARDGAAVINESALSITAFGNTWVVLFETVLSQKAAVRVAAL